MRFVSDPTDGYRIFAVTGVNTVSFAIDFSGADTAGLLGFAVERHDPAEDERYFLFGMKVFRSVVPNPREGMAVSTYDHPVQSFVWDDFTAKPGRRYSYAFHPLKGKPKKLDRQARPVAISVETEPLFSDRTHDVFFNRGVASSQAYRRRFGNVPPDKLRTEARRQEARDWLSRHLDDAILAFVDAAGPGDKLLGSFYEFRYRPVADRLAQAIARGVDVALILDGKDNATVDDQGQPQEAFPREENRRMAAAAGLPDGAITWRSANPNDIQHNKFMVLLRGAGRAPEAVWTGSTNLSDGGIHGQTNVGHWIRDVSLAAAFARYWDLLATDPGGVAGGTDNRARRRAFREAIEALGPVPARWQDIPPGATAVFSPRSGGSVLDMYANALDSSIKIGTATLAFGINKVFKSRLADNRGPDAPVVFLLLEKRDRPNPRSNDPFVPLTARQNVYQAWGSYLRDPVYHWARETNARILNLNKHVAYVHSKFMLKDPLGDDPIVITGSANFSDASTNDNDENMVLIRGDARAADIYFTEFNRLFNHYYFRSVMEALRDRQPAEANAAADTTASVFLDETDSWLAKYRPGTLRTKRVEMLTQMAGARTLPVG